MGQGQVEGQGLSVPLRSGNAIYRDDLDLDRIDAQQSAQGGPGELPGAFAGAFFLDPRASGRIAVEPRFRLLPRLARQGVYPLLCVIEPNVELAQAVRHFGPLTAQVDVEISRQETDSRIELAGSLEDAFLGRPQRPTRPVDPVGACQQFDLARREGPGVEARMDRIRLAQRVP
jgi:hypothetical protein